MDLSALLLMTSLLVVLMLLAWPLGRSMVLMVEDRPWPGVATMSAISGAFVRLVNRLWAGGNTCWRCYCSTWRACLCFSSC